MTVDKIRWLLAKAYPVIGTIPIAQITPHEAIAVLRKVEATGAYESARRMRSVRNRVFRYGVAAVRCDKDVAADLRGAIAAPKVTHFAAITKPSEVGALLRAIDGYPGHKVMVMAMRLSPHVLLRPGELRQAEWTDIDFDEAIWFIPAERMKMRRPHRVPLSRQVIAMLKELHEHNHWWRYLVPALGRPRKAMSENAVNQDLRRLGYTTQEMTAHGFRAMAATLLNENFPSSCGVGFELISLKAIILPEGLLQSGQVRDKDGVPERRNSGEAGHSGLCLGTTCPAHSAYPSHSRWLSWRCLRSL